MERKEPKFKTFEFSNKILDYAAYQYEEPTNLEIMEEKVIGVSKVLPKFLLGCPDEILPGLKTSLLLIDLLKDLFRQIKQVQTKCKKKKETAEESLGRGDIEEAIGYLTYYFHSEMVQHLGKATDELKKLWVVLEEAITDIHTMGTDFCESFRCYANGRSWKRTFKKNKMKIKTESSDASLSSNNIPQQTDEQSQEAQENSSQSIVFNPPYRLTDRSDSHKN